MKKITTLALAAILGMSMVACNSTESETTEETAADSTALVDGTMTFDSTASSVMWKGVLLGVKEHFGTVGLNEATLTVTEGKISGGKFTVDMTSITPMDTTYDAESTPEKLVGHLSSGDFFQVEEFPAATFEVTGSEGDKVMGNLTVRGITNPETVEGVMTETVDGVTTITGKLTFDRKKYDVAFDLPMKDMVLSNDIELDIKLVSAQ